jgi:branched-chain amino acid transport system substrate-binding protein
MIISKITYEVTDPTVDSQMVTLKASGADTFFNITTPKFAAQAIKKAAEIGWKPTHYLNSVSNATGSVMLPAGAEASTDIISAFYIKDPTDPQFQKGKEWDDFVAFMKKYHPSGAMNDNFNVYGYTVAQLMTHVLQKAGDNLTRENIMKQAASLDLTLPMLLPGVNIKTAPDDFFPIEREQLAKFNGKSWELFGKVYGR